MKQVLAIVFLLAFEAAASQNQNDKIIAGTIDSVYSKILKEKRKIWVHVPDSDPNAIFSKQHFPVVYLLDGDAHFFSVMGMIHQLSEINGNTICPQMIVVGIPNTNRTRDLTPSNVTNLPFLDSISAATSGGGENFTAFLEKELIPHIDSLYPTAPYRMLIGHSFGGLMVINTLINHSNLFSSYVAIDPSMWWDNRKLLKQVSNVLNQKKFNGKTLFLAIANTMNPGMDTLMVRKDTADASAHIRSILELENVLKSNAGNGLRWSYKYYNEDDHGSVPLIAEYDALHFIFSNYKLPSFQKMFDSTFNADSAVAAHFKDVSRQMGYTVLPPEPLINNLGYAFMQNKMLDKSYRFFMMNIQNYPQSFNAYDSMGDLYDVKGDKTKAIEYYEKALKLKDNPDTRQKMEKLKSRK